ncbi:MAG: HdeD family acid-resistance protein [Alphaproteobacteria bacterium]
MAVETKAESATGLDIARSLVLPAHNWGWLVVRGVLALALGAAAILFPLGALYAFTLLFAAFAFVDGIASLIAGIRGARTGERWGALVLRGVVGVAVGVLFVLMPMISTLSYAYVTIAMLVAWSVIAGVLEIQAAIRLRKEIEGEWLLGLSGLLSVALGIAILVLVMPNPAATILSAAWLIAIFAIISGVVLIAQGLRLRGKAASAKG